MSFYEVCTPVLPAKTSSADARDAAVSAILRLGDRHHDPEGAFQVLEACGLLDDAYEIRARLARKEATA